MNMRKHKTAFLSYNIVITIVEYGPLTYIITTATLVCCLTDTHRASRILANKPVRNILAIINNNNNGH